MDKGARLEAGVGVVVAVGVLVADGGGAPVTQHTRGQVRGVA